MPVTADNKQLQNIMTRPEVKRDQVRASVIAALEAHFPVAATQYVMEIRNVRVQGKLYSSSEQKQALLEGRTLSEPIKADVTLKNKQTGEVLDTKTNYTLMQLPWMTPRHTFTVDGNEYSVANQPRIKPGIYTRTRGNEEIESAFNLAKGKNFRLSLQPETGKFYMELGTSKVPLYNVLRALGATMADFDQAWGKELHTVNVDAFAGHLHKDVSNLYSKLIPHPVKGLPYDKEVNALRTYFGETKMDPEVNETTLGSAGFDKVNKDVLLRASEKLLKVYNGTAKEDDRDSLEFKSMHGVEDHFAERVRLKGRDVANKIKFKMNFAKGDPSVAAFMPVGAFTKVIRSFVTSASLSAQPTQINPIEIIDYAVKVTPLGEGGIENERTVPDEARETHATQFGILDPIKTPESSHAGIDVRAAMLAAKDSAGNMYTPMYDLRNGGQKYVSAKEIKNSVIAFPMQKIKAHSKMSAADLDREVEVLNKGEIGKAKIRDVDFYIDHPAKLYGPNTNLIPGIDGIQGNRAIMGAKMVGQSVPLKDAEAPLVQVQSYVPGRSHEQLMADMVNPTSPVDGVVSAVDEAFITVKDAAGEEHKVTYYDHFPLASKTYLHDTPKVKVGDKVTKGQHLAESIYTRGDTLAIGKNLNVAYLAYNGLNSNDAVVISEGASKKLTSLHMYKQHMSLDKQTVLSKDKFASHYPTLYSLDQLKKLDKDGVVTPGTVLDPGDPWIVALRESKPSAEDIMLGRLHKGLMRKYRDDSQAWDKDYPGTVVDVSRTTRKITVTVKVEAPMKIGDKMCFAPDHELYTIEGWKPVADITLDDVVYTLPNRPRSLEKVQPVAIHAYPHTGMMYCVDNSAVSMRVTLDHKLVVSDNKFDTSYDFVPARELLYKTYDVLSGDGNYTVTPKDVTLSMYTGTVYCVELAEHHTLLTRRNGKVHWSGNSNRFGGKSVVSTILPDDQMPRREDGEPLDAMITSASVVSRINPMQIVETSIAKAVVAQGGTPHVFQNFSTEKNTDVAKRMLAAAGVKDKERIYDPVEDKWIDNVMVGPQYTLKLFKSTDTNFSARSTGGYDPHEQPGHGGVEGAKTLGGMESAALLAHNARGLLQEASVIKSQKNAEFWRAVQLGLPTPPMRTSFAFNKFQAMLTGSGVRMERRGDNMVLAPMTDADITRMSSGKIENPRMVRAKDLSPERGGLFDEVITGGSRGTRWSHIELAEPIINPIFEEPARRLLELSQKDFKQETLKGGEQLRQKLNNIDVKQEMSRLRTELKTARAAKRNDIVKRIKYLQALDREGIKPGDAYVLSKVPVLPPVMRPVTPSKSGDLMIDDPNYLYRDLMLASESIQDAKDADLPEVDIRAARSHLYDSMSAAVGMSDPVSPQLAAKNVRGFVKNIAGRNPKQGYFQSKLISKPQDLTGRGTAAPDPGLGLDEIGLPEDIGWKMYSNFVIRRLVRSGYSAARAKELLDTKAYPAKMALEAELKERPIIYNRAPSLWRYSVVAAYPKLVKGKTIRVNPLVESGMNLDYDGDALQIHLPATDKGVAEARRMTLPHLLFSDKQRNDLLVFPQHEAIIGVFQATSAKPTGKKLRFASKKEAWAAYKKGDLALGDEVLIG